MITLARTALIAVCLCVFATSCSTVPTQRTYRNPFIYLSHNMADPDVIQVGDTYYLYPTSHGRGYDVFASKDLLNWKFKGHAWTSPRRGAWAPDLFHNKRGDGKFYLYYTDNIPEYTGQPLEKQIGVAFGDSPLGPFVDKGALARVAIDAELFQDDDGKLYLYYVDLAGGFKIRVQPMSDPVTKQGESKILIRPTEQWEKMWGEVTEAPFILKRNGIYYLMYSGSGANSPYYAIGYATSKSPMGPFTKYAGNPIASRGGNVLGPGHHCVVEGPDKNLWLIYHQKKNEDIGWSRFVAIDPLWFDDNGVIHTKLSHGTDEPVTW